MFKGLWLGGKAIVRANSKEDARQLLHKEKQEPLNEIKDIYEISELETIIYYDNGDY
jgi:hypothetical protein